MGARPAVQTSPRKPWLKGTLESGPQDSRATVLLVEPGGDRLSVQGVLATWLIQDFICLPADEDLETVFN